MAPSSRGGGRPLKSFILPGAFLVVLFAVLWVRRPTDQSESPWADAASDPTYTPHLSGVTMGTTWHATVVGLRDRVQASEAVQHALDAVDARMSTWKADSELSQLNDAPPGQAIPVSPELLHVLQIAFEVGQASGGAFDVTVAPVVDAWGFGPVRVDEPPTDAQLQELMPRVGQQLVRLDPDAGTVTKLAEGVRMDLSAVAKGYGVDLAFQALRDLGYQDVMVEVGGELRTRGVNHEGQPWRVGIERPDGSSAVYQALPLPHGAMASSGDYRNFRLVDGRRVSHTIDARTGQPITHLLASVSVLYDDCASADAWATALNVLGPEAGPALAEERGLAAYFIVHDGQGFRTLQTRTWPDSLDSKKDPQ